MEVKITVDIALDPALGATGALVWDWNAMQLADAIGPGPSPVATFRTGENRSYFLGVTPRTDVVQLVAFGGGMLGRVLDDTAAHCLAVGLYRTMVGQPVTVAVYLGDWGVTNVSVSGATLSAAGYDASGQVYLVTASAIEERVTVALEYGRRVYLPIVLRAGQ